VNRNISFDVESVGYVANDELEIKTDAKYKSNMNNAMYFNDII